MSSGWVDGVHSRNTVRGGGSSIALSSALPACSVSRSASSTSSTCQRPMGRRGLRPQHQRAHLGDADGEPLRHDEPHVGVGAAERGVARLALAAAAVRSHCSAAANARAATDRPEPAGPVNSHACVIAAGSADGCWPATIAAAAAACRSVVSVARRTAPARPDSRRRRTPLRHDRRASRTVVRPRSIGAPAAPRRSAVGTRTCRNRRWPGRVRRPGARPRRCAIGTARSTASVSAGRLGPSRACTRSHREGDHVDRVGRVDHQVAVRIGGGEVEERAPDPLVERERLGLEPVRPGHGRRPGADRRPDRCRAARPGPGAGRRWPTGTAT